MASTIELPQIPGRPLAVVTGASSGIGETFARKLAPTHDLLLVARREDRLHTIAADIAKAHGGKADVLVADLELERDVDLLGQRLRAEPHFELLVNNAGFGVNGLFWEGALAPHERMHRLHIIATLRLCHAALGALVPKNRGAIINVASVAAFIRGTGSGSYGSTKSWMTAFTEGLHLDLRSIKSKVIVQALCPGFTYSEFHDTMGVERETRAPRAFWLSADSVVAESLGGLHSGKLYVVPGWRYKLLVAFATKLPNGIRVAFQSARNRTPR
jgi:uncharacterized protein